MDKIKIVQRRGTNFDQAVEELRKTFSIPADDEDDPKVLSTTSSGSGSGSGSGKKSNPTTSAGGASQQEHALQKTKSQKNKMLKVITSIRKKKPASTTH